MKEFFEKMSEHRYYSLILFGIKSFAVFIICTFALLVFVQKVGVKVSLTDIYNYFTSTQNDDIWWEIALDNIDEQSNLNEEVVRRLFFSDKFHSAGDDLGLWSLQIRANELCDKYRNICDVLVFDWDFDQNQKDIYKILSLYFLGEIDKTLSHKGESLTYGLQKLTLRANLSKDKSQWACYTERRGCADHNTVMLNLELFKSYKEFVNVLIHEIGWHIVDLGVILWESKSLDDVFTEFGLKAFAIDDESLAFYNLSWSSENTRHKWATKEDFCSLYGMTNPFEDFAECVTAYKNNYLYFKILAQNDYVLKQKFQFIDKLYGGHYIIPNALKAKEAREDLSKRERDLTKI